MSTQVSAAKKRVIADEIYISDGRLYKGGEPVTGLLQCRDCAASKRWADYDPALFILLPEKNKWWLMTNWRYCGNDAKFEQEYKDIVQAVKGGYCGLRGFINPTYSFDAKIGLGQVLAGWKDVGYGTEIELVHFLHDHPGHPSYTIALLNLEK